MPEVEIMFHIARGGIVLKINYDENADGYTHPSLRRFRNELARRIDHKIRVYQIQTADITCGFLIIDHDLAEAVWSGDGFRTDDGGEGGAGYRTAQALMFIMNIDPEELPAHHLLERQWHGNGPEILGELIAEYELLYIDAPEYPVSERYPNYVRRSVALK